MMRYLYLPLILLIAITVGACAKAVRPTVSSVPGEVSAPAAVPAKNAAAIREMTVAEWRKYMLDRMDSTTKAMLIQLGYNDAESSNPTYSNATQTAHEKKFAWTIVGVSSSTLAGVAAGASKWIIGGLGLAGAIATAVVSHYGDQESACVTAGQAIDDVLVFRSKWAEEIRTATGSTDSNVSGYDTAEDSLVKEVRSAQYQCPISNDP